MKKLILLFLLIPFLGFSQNYTRPLKFSDDVLIDGNLTVTGLILPTELIHLFMHFCDSSISFNYTTDWQHLTNASHDMFIDSELDGFAISNDTITVERGADYDLRSNYTCDGDIGETISIRFYNITQGVCCPVSGTNTMLGTDNFISTLTESCFEFNAGDKLVMQIKGDASGTAVFKSGIIKIYYLHE